MLEVPCVPFHPHARFLTLLGCVTPVITIPRRENLTDPGLGQTLLIRPALACCPLLLIPGAGPKKQQWKEGSQSPLSAAGGGHSTGRLSPHGPFKCCWWLPVIALRPLSRLPLVPSVASSRAHHAHGLRERPASPLCGARRESENFCCPQPRTS